MLYDEKTAVERIKRDFYRRDDDGNEVLRIKDDSIINDMIKLAESLDEEIASVVEHLYELDSIVNALDSAVDSYVYNSEYLDEEPTSEYRQTRVKDARYRINGVIQLIKHRR